MASERALPDEPIAKQGIPTDIPFVLQRKRLRRFAAIFGIVFLILGAAGLQIWSSHHAEQALVARIQREGGTTIAVPARIPTMVNAILGPNYGKFFDRVH